MGGFEQRSGRATAATERYDVERDRWTRVADMPVALNHAAAAAYRGDVYVLGGYRGVVRPDGRGRDALPLRPRRATAGAGCRPRRPRAARSPSA